jgi:SOS-response transcriptional repressor LexA
MMTGNLTSFGARLRAARNRAGARAGRALPQRELAERCGWGTQSRVANYENGSRQPSLEDIAVLADALAVNPEWLAFGTSAPETASAGTQRLIPLISTIRAGLPAEIVDPYEAGDGVRQVPVDEMGQRRLGPSAFALVVLGDSMAPEFGEGDVVIIDPSAAVRPGAVVVARLNDGHEATLKRYRDRGVDDAGRPMFELVPANDNYPTVLVCADNPGSLVGPVVEHRRYL